MRGNIIWNDISARALRMDAESPGGAMSAIYRKKESSIKDYSGHFSLTDSQKGSKAERDRATKFVHAPTICRVEPHPSVGLGTDCRLESTSITGFALAHDDKILHLSAFSRKGMGSSEKSFTRMIRSSHRKRFRS